MLLWASQERGSDNMNALVNRNLKLFFKDKANVFFSMLSVLIIIALFALFLGQSGSWDPAVRDSWLMAGVLAVAGLTTSMAALSPIVEDKAAKITKGFYASPIKRSHITASYILSAFLVGVLMTILTAIGFAIFFAVQEVEIFTVANAFKLLGLIFLACLNSTALGCFIVSLLKTTNANNTIQTIISTLSGFLMGIYMPIGNFSGILAYLMMAFPPSQSAMLFRQVLMEKPLIAIEDAYVWREALGERFSFATFEVAPWMSIAYLVATTIFFFVLSVFNMRKSRN